MENEYRIIEPEVAGGLGNNSVLDYSINPPNVIVLDYEFQGWLGDDLLTTAPCFIVSYDLMKSMNNSACSGYSFGDLIVSKSDEFKDRYPNVILPAFYWLKIHGLAGIDDAGLDRIKRLVVSDNLLTVLKQHKIGNCIIRRKPYLHSRQN